MRATGAHKAQSALLNHEAREARSVPSVAKSAFAVSVPDKARGVNVVSTRISFAAHCRCQAAWRGKPWRHSRPPSAAPRTTDTNFRSTDRNPSRMMVLWKTVGWFPQSEDHHTEGRLENGVFPRSIRINLPSFHPSILPSSGKEWGPQLSGRRGQTVRSEAPFHSNGQPPEIHAPWRLLIGMRLQGAHNVNKHGRDWAVLRYILCRLLTRTERVLAAPSRQLVNPLSR
jgi:hypothetical protein